MNKNTYYIYMILTDAQEQFKIGATQYIKELEKNSLKNRFFMFNKIRQIRIIDKVDKKGVAVATVRKLKKLSRQEKFKKFNTGIPLNLFLKQII